MGQQLAIIGDFTRGNEVIELLEMLGGVNGKINKNTGKAYNIYNGNYFISEIGRVREVAYYIDFTSQIRCIDIKDITGHFIVYSLEVFLEQYPFKIGDKVILDNKLCSIIWMCWECNNIYYQVQGIDDIFTKKVTANELKPYKKTNMKYKVGDKVRIKNIDWYNENKNEYGNVKCHLYEFSATMRQYCGTIRTIRSVDNFDKKYKMVEDGCHFDWTDEMIEGLVEEETKPEFDYVAAMDDLMGLDIEKSCILNDFDEYKKAVEKHGYFSEEALTRKLFINLRKNGTAQNVLENFGFNLPDGYIFKDENGNVINATKIVLEKKKKEYPKTYEECLKILGFTTIYTPKVEPIFDYDDDIIALQKIKNCRNAYWKLYGDEIGLGKPWEPDSEDYAYVIARKNNSIILYESSGENEILEFPTAEMRDAFYENFKEEIEKCKELL